MQTRSLSLAVAAAFALPALALSSIAHAAAEQSPTDLDEIVVTATRTAISADAALAPVEVIDREEIVRSQATSLPDLLRGRAGISISNQGGAGKLTTLFMRGSESDHVLVLVDGIRIGSATSGLAAFQQIPLMLIERIEIVRGPRSSLYGSEAIGGVIQIFTRRHDRDGGWSGHASASVGSHGYAAGSVGIGGGSERAWFGIDAAYKNDEGINACDVATPTPFSGGCFISAPEPDADGYRLRSLSLRGGFAPSDTLAFTGHALRSEGRNEYDGDWVNLSKTVQQVIGGNVRWQPSERVTLQLTAGRNRDASVNLLHKFDAFADRVVHHDRGFFETDRDSVTVQGDFQLAQRHLLSVGLDWLHDRADSNVMYAQAERDNRAVFAQYQGRFDRQSLQLSARHDDNEQFGSHTTGAIAWGIALAERWRLTASYGTAFKAPTFNELYYPYFGNPDLRPEQSRSWNAGLRYDGARVDWRLDGYSTRVDDLIVFDAAINLPGNIERARMRGLELGLETQLDDWRVDASVSYLDTENLGGLNAGNELPRRARHSARVAVDRAFGDLRLGVTAIAAGSRYDDVANTRRLPGYATLDLRAAYALSPDWTVQARLANVFDNDYQTTSFYNQPGREWFVTLRWQPGE